MREPGIREYDTQARCAHCGVGRNVDDEGRTRYNRVGTRVQFTHFEEFLVGRSVKLVIDIPVHITYTVAIVDIIVAGSTLESQGYFLALFYFQYIILGKEIIFISYRRISRIIEVLISTRSLHLGDVASFQSGFVTIGSRVDVRGRILRRRSLGQRFGRAGNLNPFYRRVGFQISRNRTDTDVRLVAGTFELDVTYISRPGRGATYFRYTTVFAILVKDFEMVDVHLVVVNQAIVLTGRRETGRIYFPSQFHRQRRGSLFLHIDKDAFAIDFGRTRSGAVVAQHELANHNLIIVAGSTAFHTETDILDYIARVDTAKSDFFLFPVSTGQVAYGKFQPVGIVEFSQNQIQIRRIGAFYTRLHGNLGFGVTGRYIQFGTIQPHIGTRRGGSTFQAQCRTTDVSIFVSKLGFDVGRKIFGTRVVDDPTIGGHIVLLTHVVPAAQRLFTFVGIEIAVTQRKVGVERQVALNSRTLGNELGQTTEIVQLIGGTYRRSHLERTGRVRNGRTVERRAIGAAEYFLQQFLIVGLQLHQRVTYRVLEDTAHFVFAPQTYTATFCIIVCDQARPRAVHMYHPHTGIETVGSTHGCFGSLYRSLDTIREIATTVIQHQVGRLTGFGRTIKSICIPGTQS